MDIVVNILLRKSEPNLQQQQQQNKKKQLDPCKEIKMTK